LLIRNPNHLQKLLDRMKEFCDVTPRATAAKVSTKRMNVRKSEHRKPSHVLASSNALYILINKVYQSNEVDYTVGYQGCIASQRNALKDLTEKGSKIIGHVQAKHRLIDTSMKR